jgi:hypothetical protein
MKAVSSVSSAAHGLLLLVSTMIFGFLSFHAFTSWKKPIPQTSAQSVSEVTKQVLSRKPSPQEIVCEMFEIECMIVADYARLHL